MVYRQTPFEKVAAPKTAKCLECGSTRMRFGYGKITCTECGKEVAKPSKYRNVRQTYNNYNYDSRFEANVAAGLDLRKRAGDIKDWERQFKLDLYVNGKLICKHYVDFRILHNDGTYELYEAKGKETETWRLKRKLLEAIYLPEHRDTIYTVVKQ